MKSPLNKLSLKSHAEFSCRHCSHYVPEGRRGGTCELLGVGVQSQWAACGQILPVLSGAESVPISHSASHSADGSSLVNASSSVNA
ncbi:MAG: hypothetical protein MH252_20400 [Thermosynechococcaceae cyanobacterium MS004]|nr:hypothetical protein [Thermosynechococcaceae cyanobacterium MS004]